MQAALCSGLSACAVVDSRSAAPGFAGTAHDARDAFVALDRSEADAFLAEALSQPATDLRLFPTRECLVEDGADVAKAARCRVRITVRGEEADVGATGPSLVAAADGLVGYADAIATAAAARDIDTRRDALRSAATSAGSLATMAGIPGIASVVTLIADASRARDVARRRRAVARIAEAADPAIQSVASLMTSRAEKLRENVVLARSQDVVVAESGYVAATQERDRASLARGVLAATIRLRLAAAASVDFSSLGRAHRALIASLSRPKADPSDALRMIETFAADANSLRRAVGDAK